MTGTEVTTAGWQRVNMKFDWDCVAVRSCTDLPGAWPGPRHARPEVSESVSGSWPGK